MPSLLVVDDDEAVLEVMQGYFRLWSKNAWKISIAHSVGQAIKLLHEQKFDVAVTDMRMPVMDGLQFLRLLTRSHPNLLKVVLTGFPDEAHRHACLSAGASLYLEKPRGRDEFESLCEAIRETLEQPQDQGFFGLVRNANLGEMVQMLCMGGGSLVFDVSSPSRSGRIYIQGGEVVHAESGGLTGFDAFYQIMALHGGKFETGPFVDPGAITIHHSWTSLLLECAQHLDEETANSSHPADLSAWGLPPLPVRELGPDLLTRLRESQRLPRIDLLPFRDATPGSVPSKAPVQTGLDEFVVSGEGAVVTSLGSHDPDLRADLLDFLFLKGQQIAAPLGLGQVESVEIQGTDFAAAVILKPEVRAFGLAGNNRASGPEIIARLDGLCIRPAMEVA